MTTRRTVDCGTASRSTESAAATDVTAGQTAAAPTSREQSDAKMGLIEAS